MNCLLALVLALPIVAVGIRLMVQSDFGISTLSALPVVLNLAFPVINLGYWNLIIQTIYLIILYVICRKSVFYYVVSLLLTVYYSLAINLVGPFITSLPTPFALRLVYFFSGFLITALGVSLQILSRYPIMPFDCFVRDIAEHFGANIKLVRRSVDFVSVSLSVLISVLFVGRLAGIGVGTIFAMIFMGPTLNIIVSTLPKYFHFVKFGDAPEN